MAKKGARVCAVDYSDIALMVLRKASQQVGLFDRISVLNEVLDESFPFESESFDLTIDSYVSCHFTDDGFRQSYRDELFRVTKSGGRLFSSSFSYNDEYYREIRERSGDPGNLVTDPVNGVTKRLFEEEELKDFFAARFKIEYFTTFEFIDNVLGKDYMRSIFAVALRK
jgi:SAM-dependent methyltransferase